MSGQMSALVHHRTAAPTRRRVRHDVRDGLAVMAFSLAASVLLAMAFLTVMVVAGS